MPKSPLEAAPSSGLSAGGARDIILADLARRIRGIKVALDASPWAFVDFLQEVLSSPMGHSLAPEVMGAARRGLEAWDAAQEALASLSAVAESLARGTGRGSARASTAPLEAAIDGARRWLVALQTQSFQAVRRAIEEGTVPATMIMHVFVDEAIDEVALAISTLEDARETLGRCR